MSENMAIPSCDILVVDDDGAMAATLQQFLRQEGYEVEVALSAAEALHLQERIPHIAVALVDLIMPLQGGLELMEQLHRRSPELPVVIMTGYGTIETAVEAIKRGAEDYLTKPFDQQVVRKKIARLMEVYELRERVAQLESNFQKCCASFEHLVYVSPLMQRAVERAQAAAATDAPVFLVGETGTGKEMLARAIHASSPRRSRPFLPVNCGALPRDLVESELFGHRRGAFTGAYADAPGIFAAATGGTVFLDEVGEMPKEVQVKLLRVLQGGELRPLGSPKPVQIDVRIISATNHPLAELRSDHLREDLYFRIATVVIEVPPLRTRPEDVLVLSQYFTSRLAQRYDREITLSRLALDLLLCYRFPGNVRELEHILESVAALSHDDPQTITDRDLRPLLQHSVHPADYSLHEPAMTMEDLERVAIQRALRLCQGNRTKAASLLGISRDTLHRRLRESAAPK
ncbi:MAG: sigma-54-dependent Fis family transcriptional regulator [Acidobacteriales bacterium]|nr:sigma-54-dependent Fis family transcriptional regulator [Candidatus Koribacter versatilis]MBI3645332.1 sigma-54-dependent Fis family transcriptional regulator [Terriglobales bacterium]